MLQQMAGLSLHYPPRTISLLAFLLLAHSCQGQSQLFGAPKPIVATVGDDVILPCHLQPTEDVAAKTLEWTRPNLNPRFVFVWRAGQDLENVKNPSYKGRTSLFPDELKQGNMSLKLSKVKPSDTGRYKCYIPDMNIDSFIELVVGAVSLPIISLAGIHQDKGGVVLQCDSKGWYPEPEVLWLDGEGILLSAGPTETVRGPDDLYTVSSRVTVEKRQSNSFTCRVQQKNTNQTRETQIHVPDDFFEVQSSFSVPIITGLAVSLSVCIILFILLLLFSVWKWRQNTINTKISHRDETDLSVTAEETKALTGKKEQQRREEAGRENQTVKEELETKKKELQEEQQRREKAEREVQTLKGELETNKKELEEKASLSLTLKEEQRKREEAEKQVHILTQKLDEKNNNKVKDHESSQSKSQDYSLTSPASQDSATEHIIVDEVDPKGTYVRLCSKSNQDIPLGDWELHLHVDNRKPIKYQFMPTFELKAGEAVTIWVSGCKGWCDTSTDLVWKDQTSWGTGKQLLVSLYSSTGELEVRKSLQFVKSQNTYQEKDPSLTNQDSAKRHIILDEVDLEGKYVRLCNMSKKDQQLKDWELHINVNNRKPILFKFPNSFKLKDGKTVTIWATGCGVNDNPPTDLVWEDQTSWGSGEQLLVSLYSCNGKLEARKMSEGRIIVNEVDPEGKYVCLTNKSNKNKPLKGWELHLQINNRKPSVYTSFDSFILKTGETVTIWASYCSVNDNSPTDLVWSSQKPWDTGEQLLVSLYSQNGELEASKMMQLGNPQKYQENNTCVISQDSDKGHIIVDEVDPEGKYVRLCNNSKTDQEMENWELYLHVNNKKPIIYTFQNSLKLKAGECVKIWASRCGVNDNPPTDLVWKDQKPWGTGEQLLVSVYSHNGEVMTTKEVGF